MKYTLIAAIVVLALAQGTLSAETELEKMNKFFEGMRAELMATAQRVSESLQSQTIVEDGMNQAEPFLTQIKENLAPLATTVQEKISPMAENMQQQMKPFVDQFQAEMEGMFRNLMEQAQAIGN